MGIKYMTATPEEAAKLKTKLVGIAIAGIVILGAYGIWMILTQFFGGMVGMTFENRAPESVVVETTPGDQDPTEPINQISGGGGGGGMPTIEPTGISFEQSEARIHINDEPITLTATIQPDDANSKTEITYMSMDGNIASVDSKTGELTAVAIGTTTIVARTENGKEARMNVRVEAEKEIEADMGGMELVNANVKYWRYIPHIEDIGTYHKIPLIIYLHGGNSGETNPNSHDAIGYSLPKYLKDGTLKANAIIASPVSYSQSSVMELIQRLKSQYDIDENNISITGHSTGAYFAFNIAVNNQNVFSKCVPVSLRYSGSYAKIKNINNCDVRFIFESNFGGSPRSEQEMENIKKEVDRLNRAGATVTLRYETLPNTGHNEVVKCYNSELINWIIGGNSTGIAYKENKAEETDIGGMTAKTASVNGMNINYWCYVPHLSDIKTYKMIPLIIYLHGNGKQGDNINSVLADSLPKYLHDGMINANAIIIAPQRRKDEHINTQVNNIPGLISELKKTYDIDENRISITGHSEGGVGAFRAGNKYTNLFSACVPVSAFYSGDHAMVKSIYDNSSCALRFIYEQYVPGENSQNEVAAVKREVEKINNSITGKTIQYETISGTTHETVAEQYYKTDLLNWMIEQRKTS